MVEGFSNVLKIQNMIFSYLNLPSYDKLSLLHPHQALKATSTPPSSSPTIH